MPDAARQLVRFAWHRALRLAAVAILALPLVGCYERVVRAEGTSRRSYGDIHEPDAPDGPPPAVQGIEDAVFGPRKQTDPRHGR